MRKILFVSLLILSAASLKSQQLYFDAGKTISSFVYKNSQGNSLDNLQATNHVFMDLGYRMNVFIKNLYLDLGGNYNSYGATGSDRVLDNYFAWDVSYLGAGFGLDYEVFKPGNFIFFVKGSASSEFLIQGIQTLNNQVYRLPGEEDFKSPLYFLRAGLGVQYEISEKLTFFTQYMYGRSGSFKNVQGDLKIRAHNFGFGLFINISKNQKAATEIGSAQIMELKKELEKNSQKVKELEAASTRQVDVLEQKVVAKDEEIVAKEAEIVAKEAEIKSLKESISSALLPFEGKGLTIKERDGKVYVTMENDMLFQSGSWKTGTEGENAVNALGSVLADNPDVTVLIEGHTDNEPFKGSGNINNNWDLSTKRATAIVEILRNNKNINPKNLTAAGRGEYDPIADNATIEGKAKNRRIEVIITPKLDEVLKLIKK